MEDTTKFRESKLGRKQYWDDLYALERENFKQNPEDIGQCWFSDNGAEQKMIDFLVDNVGEFKITEEASILDLGTGNGHLLFGLHDNDFSGPMVGVDYSTESVKFAAQIAESRGLSESVSFHAADIFDENWQPGKFDVVLDKGTLDAIALSGVSLENGKTVVEVYAKVIEKLLPRNGLFLITSCNFTEKELTKIIETDSLRLWKSVKYPTFKFGGIEGSAICTIAFVKE